MATAPTFTTPTITGGVNRWVQTTFVLAGALAAYLIHKVGATLWEIFDEPNKYALIAIAFGGGLTAALLGYRSPRVHDLTTEVVTELQRVTWPTRKETGAATLVVLVTSIICAILLGLFDTMWSKLTDVIYGGG